jgi:hypothetical protein
MAPQEIEAAVRRVQERFGDEPQRMKFVVDGVSELVRVASALRLAELRQGGPAHETFAKTLVRTLANHLPTQDDPLARARARGLLAQKELLDFDGPALSGADVARVLKVSRQAVDKRRLAGKLLGVSTGTRSYRYPAWQLTATGILPGLEDVLAELRSEPAWARLRFFVSGNHRLADKTPTEWLRRGRIEPVLEAARAFGEQGAA